MPDMLPILMMNASQTADLIVGTFVGTACIGRVRGVTGVSAQTVDSIDKPFSGA
jgi:hypothetical protein